MGHPFLGEYETPEDRREAIATEVEQYLLSGSGEPPEALVWLNRIRTWGLPCSGGLIDQPYYFMLDMEAAALGEARARHLEEVNRKLRQMWESGQR